MVGTNTLLHNDSEKRSEKNKKKGGLSIQIMLVWDIDRGGTMGAKTNFLKVPKWILLWFQYIRSGKKEFLDLESILTLHIGPEFSHFWPKIAEKWPLGENAVAEYCQTF